MHYSLYEEDKKKKKYENVNSRTTSDQNSTKKHSKNGSVLQQKEINEKTNTILATIKDAIEVDYHDIEICENVCQGEGTQRFF